MSAAAGGGVLALLNALDRDARTIYDLACAREELPNATREDVEAKRIALRQWEQLGELRAALSNIEGGR